MKKEKLLITSNFSNSYGVFKRLVPRPINKGIFWKGLRKCLYSGAKQQQTSTEKQQQPQQNYNQQQKRENSYQKLKQQHQGPQGQPPREQQQVYPPPLMELQVQPSLPHKRPPLLMTPSQGGNR